MRLATHLLAVLVIGATCSGCQTCGKTSSTRANPEASRMPANVSEWFGVIGTGQSLAVGEGGKPAKATKQPYHNLRLWTGGAVWPLDAADPSFKLVPLTEPIGRLASDYPSAYPTNIAGETPHTAMANQISSLYRQRFGKDYVGVHGEFGESGQCLKFLAKHATMAGVNGRAYAASLMETRAIARLAKA